MRRKPGTDTKFPAHFAGNWLSVPGFAPRDMLPVRCAPQTVKHPSTSGGTRHSVLFVIIVPKRRGGQESFTLARKSSLRRGAASPAKLEARYGYQQRLARHPRVSPV